MKIYVASSWKNDYQPEVVRALRAAGHEVYDFKNPKEGDHGFHWKDVALDRNEQGLCLPADLQRALAHPVAVDGFKSDFDAMKWADACVLVLPCGRSAHLETGWLAGAGKLTCVIAPPGPIEPELMYGLLGRLCTGMDEVLGTLMAPSRRTALAERCFICGLTRGGSGATMCRVCGSAFDRAMENDDGTLMAMMKWAALRARRFAAKGKKR